MKLLSFPNVVPLTEYNATTKATFIEIIIQLNKSHTHVQASHTETCLKMN